MRRCRPRCELSARALSDSTRYTLGFRPPLPIRADISARFHFCTGRLFEGDLSEQDKLVYVNNVLKGKLLESEKLWQQAASNTKEQFANSPDLKTEVVNATMDAHEAHNAMSTQALDSEAVRNGITEILLGPGQLYETLRSMQRPGAA